MNKRLRRWIGTAAIPTIFTGAGCVPLGSEWSPIGEPYTVGGENTKDTKSRTVLDIKDQEADLDKMVIDAKVTGRREERRIVSLDRVQKQRKHIKIGSFGKISYTMLGITAGCTLLGGLAGLIDGGGDSQMKGGLIIGSGMGVGMCIYSVAKYGDEMDWENDLFHTYRIPGKRRIVVLTRNAEKSISDPRQVFSDKPMDGVEVIAEPDIGLELHGGRMTTDSYGSVSFRIASVPDYWAQTVPKIGQKISEKDLLEGILDKDMRDQFMQDIAKRAQRTSYKVRLSTDTGYEDAAAAVDIEGYEITSETLDSCMERLVDNVINSKIIDVTVVCRESSLKTIPGADVRVISSAYPPRIMAESLFKGDFLEMAVPHIDDYVHDEYEGETDHKGDMTVPLMQGFDLAIQAVHPHYRQLGKVRMNSVKDDNIDVYMIRQE
ncbi:hypothetical protein GF351_06415 [Candidatus Woesearchaeota archaeon]|nr:hypothetical protein [Candidatus Woesearchaeota archaeon]